MARWAVTARKARGTFAMERPTTQVAPLDAARTPQRGVPTEIRANQKIRHERSNCPEAANGVKKVPP
jgi:hypothetical protein